MQYKLVIVTLLLFIITISTGCSISKTKQRPKTNSAQNPAQHSTANQELFTMANGTTVTYKKEKSRSISAKSGHEETVLTDKYPSRPIISPDKKKLAYIAPREWEEIGEVFVFDSVTGQNKVLIGKNSNLQQTTAKITVWLDNTNLLVIIGPAYGTVTVGGDLYLLDTESKKLSLVMKNQSPYHEIKDMKVSNEVVTLYIANFNKEMTSHTTSSTTLTLEQVKQRSAK